MILALRQGDDGEDAPGGGDVELDIEDRESVGDESVRILCGACRHELATGDSREEVDGAHRHVKVNPHGHVFHIACFQPAPGVMPTGKPSGEFSWFSGFRWQIALCGGCHVHVGWAFSGDGEFSALIEGRYIEDEE